MSKKKRRHRGERINNENYNNNRVNNAPFGINPTQLMSMLGGNVDMGQIGNMISSMKMDGFDLNNLNLGQGMNNQEGRGNIANNRNGFDLGALQNIMGNLGMGGFNLPNLNSTKDNLNISKEENEILEEDSIEDDENIQMLIAIKSIVDSKKAVFIDKVIKAYNNGQFK